MLAISAATSTSISEWVQVALIIALIPWLIALTRSVGKHNRAIALIIERCGLRHKALDKDRERLDRDLTHIVAAIDKVKDLEERTSKNVIRLAVANDVEVDEGN